MKVREKNITKESPQEHHILSDKLSTNAYKFYILEVGDQIALLDKTDNVVFIVKISTINYDKEYEFINAECTDSKGNIYIALQPNYIIDYKLKITTFPTITWYSKDDIKKFIGRSYQIL